MSPLGILLVLAAILVGGLFAVFFLLKARIGRYLELQNLLSGVREEARSLVMEMNETADRNVSLVEDRMIALRGLLDEVDRRMGVSRRELESREAEREVYQRLSRVRRAPASSSSPEADRGLHEPQAAPRREERSAAPASSETPITLSLNLPKSPGEATGAPSRPLPELRVAEDVVPGKSRREEAYELHRQGISADLIAARLGATVSEIELLVEIEERRRAGGLS
jgi:hypothetical protein